MRLDKFLIEWIDMPKHYRKKLLKEQKLLIDGIPAVSLSQNIDSELQTIEIDGQFVQLPTEKYFVMNKPVGVITAVSDDDKQTVLDLINPNDRINGLYPVGRLDRNTSGLLLLTNNGPLGLRMLHPKHHVSKTYLVGVNGRLTDGDCTQFERGVLIDQMTLCQPAQMKIISSQKNYSVAEVTISEGKHHQIKKMFLTIGVKVIELKRISFGPLILDENLSPGTYRQLTNEERKRLKKYLI